MATSDAQSNGQLLAAASIGLALGQQAVVISSFGVLVPAASAALGWSQPQTAPAFTIFMLVVIILSPIVGRLVDRFGIRPVLAPSLLLFGATLGALGSLSGPLWMLYVGYAILAVAGIGTSSLVYSRAVVSRFTERRGLALGIALSGMGIGIAAIPAAAQLITNMWGWRGGFYALGGAVLLTAPLIILWLGAPSAIAVSEKLQAGNSQSIDGSGRLWLAVQSREFALLSLSFLLLGVVGGAIAPFVVPILTSQGIAVMQAALLASSLGLSLIVGRVIIGFLLDRVFAPHLMMGTAAAALAGITLLLFDAGPTWSVVAFCLTGFTIGADTDFMAYLVSRYFPSSAYGSIYGALLALFTLGVAMGPLVMKWSAGAEGGYHFAYTILWAAGAVSIVPLFLLGRYPNPDTPSGR